MNTQYQFFSELFLRTPYYSFINYNPERLSEVVNESAFRNALYLASPVFYNIIAGRNFDLAKLNDKEKLTLLKYYNRMCFRPIPFGSFASFSITIWGEGKTLKLVNSDEIILHLLPDQDLLMRDLLKSDPTADNIVTVNPGLYKTADEFRYFKSNRDSKGRRKFSVDALPIEDFHKEMFDLLRKKRYTTEELACWLVEETGCEKMQAFDYIDFLLKEQILLDNSAGSIIEEKFKDLPAGALNATGEFWNKWRRVILTEDLSIAEAAADFKKIKPSIDNSDRQLFYAGLERPAVGSALGKTEQIELNSAVQALISLSLPLSSGKLRKFIKEFEDKFDRQRVPLLEAIDPDIGIAYGSIAAGPIGVLTNIDFPDTLSVNSTMEWTDIHKMLFRLMSAAQLKGCSASIEITPADLPNIKYPVTPVSMAVMFRKTEEYVVIDHVGGITGNWVIGRFSAFSPDVLKLCRKIVAAENAQHPNVIFTDIGQLSDNHADNINRRKRMYPFELPINVYSDVSFEKQLRPDDLVLSVRRGELILESVSKDKRVIPRLPTAYNYGNNQLSLFQLLCDMQYQSLQTDIHFDLENFFPGLNYYPRVIFGKTILAMAKWRFEEKEILALINKTGGDVMTKIKSFKLTYKLPKRVCLTFSDQQLVFNLSNLEEAVFFLSCLKGNKSILLTEYLLPGRNVKVGDKPMASQFVAFLKHEEKIYNEVKKEFRITTETKSRIFMLGSNWLYLKIYCAPQTANEVLNKIVDPLIWSDRSKVVRWFFIRYQDPDFHLRLRINIEGEQIGRILDVLAKLVAMPENKGLVKNYVGDSYQREIERYGDDIIEDVEELFYSGSMIIKRYVELQTEEESGPNNIQLGISIMNGMMQSFFFELSESINFTEMMIESFSIEFGVNKKLKIDLDAKYREIIDGLIPYLKNMYSYKGLMFFIHNLMNKTKDIFRKIANRPDKDKNLLLADLIHMQMNRIFEFEQRRHEFMCYYFLNKYLVTKKERSRRGLN